MKAKLFKDLYLTNTPSIYIEAEFTEYVATIWYALFRDGKVYSKDSESNLNTTFPFL